MAKNQSRESCVALSAADVYCTGWAGWGGGRLEWGPVPPAALPQGAGAGTGPALAVHSMWKAPECEAARHTHTHTPAHTHTRTHTHTTHAQAPGSLGRCLPQPQGSGSSACLRPSAAYGDMGLCSPPAQEWGTVCSWVLTSLRATIPQTLPNLPPVLDHHPSPWVCERGAGTRAAPGLRPQLRGGVLRVTHRDVFRSEISYTELVMARMQLWLLWAAGEVKGQRGFAAGSGRQGQTLVGDDTPGGPAQ